MTAMGYTCEVIAFRALKDGEHRGGNKEDQPQRNEGTRWISHRDVILTDALLSLS